MKNILSTLLIFSLVWSTLANASDLNVLNNMRTNLEGTLKIAPGSKDLKTLKEISEERNTDIQIAFQNYLIAKKRVSIARAAFNPITTGHLLGISLGITYLWAPIAIEAVLSIPTKLYNESSSRHMAKAELYNSRQAKLALNNELAHLYYDLLTHEVILKSIDQELEVLFFQQDSIAKLNNKSKFDANKASILYLKMERTDIYNLYVEELAALKTLLTLSPNTDLKLAQQDKELNKNFLNDLNLSKLQDFSLLNSNEYKRSLNIARAANSNVKSVKWSILSFSGLNFSYKARVREAKVNAETAKDQQVSTALTVKNSSLVGAENLESSLSVFENYNEIYKDSMSLSEDYNKLYSTGNATQDAASETAISAIRDFRNKVVSHYAAWSSFDDFSKLANFNFTYAGANDSAQRQVEGNPLFDISENDFQVVKKIDNSSLLMLAVQSNYSSKIEKVEYVFDNNEYVDQTSTKDTKDFYAIFSKSENAPSSVSGMAIVYLNNGHELEIKFKY